MDHSHMNHGDMGHGGMGDMCSMNMLFTWDTTNLCVVFRWWHVRGPVSLFVTLLAVAAFCVGYEALREAIRRYETWSYKRLDELPSDRVTENSPFLWSGRNQIEVNKRAHIIKALLYGVQTFYAFMIMLLFMTYNGWVMLAVGVGAALGYILFGSTTPVTRETACH